MLKSTPFAPTDPDIEPPPTTSQILGNPTQLTRSARYPPHRAPHSGNTASTSIAADGARVNYGLSRYQVRVDPGGSVNEPDERISTEALRDTVNPTASEAQS